MKKLIKTIGLTVFMLALAVQAQAAPSFENYDLEEITAVYLCYSRMPAVEVRDESNEYHVIQLSETARRLNISKSDSELALLTARNFGASVGAFNMIVNSEIVAAPVRSFLIPDAAADDQLYFEIHRRGEGRTPCLFRDEIADEVNTIHLPAGFEGSLEVILTQVGSVSEAATDDDDGFVDTAQVNSGNQLDVGGADEVGVPAVQAEDDAPDFSVDTNGAASGGCSLQSVVVQGGLWNLLGFAFLVAPMMLRRRQ